MLLLLFSVNSQELEIGSDDTSNDYTNGDSSEFLLSESSSQANRMENLNADYELTARSPTMQDLNLIGGVIDNENMMDIEEEEWPVARWIRLQEEEEAETRGRLTAPSNEIRKRQTKKKSNSKNDQLVDELRNKQIDLVDQQIALQKLQREIAESELDKNKEKLKLI